ncbi:MAG: hypothetical protein IK066_03890 [Kiritimatiellae bacterium]|nr:hypothetical protein [Kiritimatiellia bacterium]
MSKGKAMAWWAAGMAVLTAWAAWAGELRPGETAEPPAEEAVATLEAFLGAQKEGEWSKALYFVDLANLRSSLLERRLAELKKTTPGLSGKDLEEISAVLQTRELAPARVRGILADLWEQQGLKGKGWSVEGWLATPDLGQGTWLARVRRGDAENGRDELVGMRLGDDGWQVAPDLMERVAAVQAASAGRRVPAEVPMPEEVASLVEGYWQAWREGRPEAAWEAMGEKYREANPLDAYLARAAAISARWGVPVAWKVEHCRELGTGLLGLGYAVTAKIPLQALVIVTRGPNGWTLADVQLRPADAAGAPDGGAGAGAKGGGVSGGDAHRFAPSLKPAGLKTDLKTNL